jgi:hypothetical protein
MDPRYIPCGCDLDSWGLFSVQLLDFVNMDMNFRIPKRKCNWLDFRLSLDVFDLMGF